MKNIMTHVVAGYPSADECIELMLGMQKLGVGIIEVQIPFSDPIADGETIMKANDIALGGGMTTAASFELIQKANLDCDVYLMSYIQKVRHYGFEKFCDRTSTCGAKGLIIPDLPYDSPEYTELVKRTQGLNLRLIPVLSPGMEEKRLNTILEESPLYVYVTSQRGITGNSYNNTRELHQLVAYIKHRSSAQIMIGFGISSRHDVEEALRIGDIAIVGSAIIREVEKSGVKTGLKLVKNLGS